MTKTRPFVVTWREAVRESDLTSTQKLVAMILSTHMKPDGSHGFAGATVLATECSLSRRAVQKARGELEDAGWLMLVEKGGRAGEERRANDYRAVLPFPQPMNQGYRSSEVTGASERDDRRTWSPLPAHHGRPSSSEPGQLTRAVELPEKNPDALHALHARIRGGRA